VRFAEVARDDLLQHGVNWNALFRNGSFTFGIAQGSGLLPVSPGTGASSQADRVEAVIEALQGKGVLKVLAEPNITAISGKTASFLAGGEIPVPVPVGRDIVGIEYKAYGVSLSVTPTVLPGDRIALDVRPEVSSLSPASGVRVGGVDIPAFLVRRVDTRVEMGSGQTFAIAGLFEQRSSDALRKLPLLGDVPILGHLFRSRRFQRNQTELVVLITPYLVRAASADALATPLDDVKPSTKGPR
jgi:pilus assembly protein CpaC